MMAEFLKILSYATNTSPEMASKMLLNVEIFVPEFKKIQEKMILNFLREMPANIRANPIQAIKHVRQKTGADLYTAKTIVWDMLGKN